MISVHDVERLAGMERKAGKPRKIDVDAVTRNPVEEPSGAYTTAIEAMTALLEKEGADALRKAFVQVAGAE